MKKYLFYLLLSLLTYTVSAQYEESESRHFIRLETSYWKNYYRPVKIEPTENWKGYKLPDDATALGFNAIWGWDYNETNLVGIGAGYHNFDGMDAGIIFSEIDFMISNSYVNPYIGLRAGYSHVWNQYENGTGSVLGEFITGIQFRFGTYSYSSIHLQTGISYTQQSLLIPIRISYQF